MRQMRKALSFLLVFSLLWGTLPVTVLAESTAETQQAQEAAPEIATEPAAPPTAAPAPSAVQEAAGAQEPQTEETEPAETQTEGTEPTSQPQTTAPAEATASPEASAEPSLQPEESPSAEPSAQPETPVLPALNGFTLGFVDAGLAVLGYTGARDSVTVPAAVDGWPVVAVATGAFANLETLTDVELSDGIARLESGAFDNCPALTRITLPASLTDIAADAVKNCPLVAVTAPEGSAAEAFGQTLQPKDKLTLSGLALESEPLPFADAFTTAELNTDGWYTAPSKYELDYAVFADYQLNDTSLVSGYEELDAALTLSAPDWMGANKTIDQDDDGAYHIRINLLPTQSGSDSYTLTFTLGTVTYAVTQPVTVLEYESTLSDSTTQLNLNPSDFLYQEDGQWIATVRANERFAVSSFFSLGVCGGLEMWNWNISVPGGNTTLGGDENHWYTFPEGDTTAQVWCSYGRNLRVTSEPITVRGASGFDSYFETTQYANLDETWYYVPGHNTFEHYARYQLASWYHLSNAKLQFGVAGGDDVVTPTLICSDDAVWLRLLPIGTGSTTVTLTAYFPTFSVSKQIPITVQAMPEAYPDSMSVSQAEIYTDVGETFTWPTAVFTPAGTQADTAHLWIHNRINRDESIEIDNGDGTYQTDYVLSQPGVYAFDLMCGLGMGVVYNAPFTVYCGVDKPTEGADFDSLFTLENVNDIGLGYAPGITNNSPYANIVPKSYTGQTITYQVAIRDGVPVDAWVDAGENGEGQLTVMPQGTGEATLTVLATVNGVVYTKDISLNITAFCSENTPRSVKMVPNSIQAHAGEPFYINYTPVPSTASLSDLPDGHRIFRVLNDNRPDEQWDYEPDHIDFSTWTFDSPGVYYCQLVFGVGMNIEVTSDVFTVFVDTPYTDFNRLFRLENNYGYGMPTEIYGGAEQGGYTCGLSLNQGSGLTGFQVNEINSLTPDILSVDWKFEDNYCTFTLQPKGYGDAQIFIGVQDSNGVNYGQTFNITLLPLPDGWELPTLSIDGLTGENWLEVDGNLESYTVPYALAGAYASLFTNPVVAIPTTSEGWQHFTRLGDASFHFDQPGLYPMALWTSYRNMDVLVRFYAAVTDADGELPQPSLGTYFNFNWNQDGDGGLYFMPDLAEEVSIGSISLADNGPFTAQQVSYSVMPLVAEGVQPCADVRLSDGDGDDGSRSVLVLPNTNGAAGITEYQMTATVTRGESEEPLVLTENFTVRMQALEGSALPTNPLALTEDDLYLDYHPVEAGEDNYVYPISWPGITLPAGKAFPQGSRLDLYEVDHSDNWYRWDQLDQNGAYEAITSGQPFASSHWGSERRIYDLCYVVRYGNLRWDAAFTLRVGMDATDAAMLFDVNEIKSDVFYGGSANKNVFVVSFRNPKNIDMTDYGADVINGGDVIGQLETYTDDSYDHGEHEYTELGVNGTLKGTGTATVRLWAVIGGVTYSRDVSFTVVPLPEDILKDVTLKNGNTMNVKAGEHFHVPATLEDLNSIPYGWDQFVNLNNNDNLLYNNDVWGDHSTTADTEFWIDQPGRYLLSYELDIGANYYIVKNIDVTVTLEDGTLPVQKVTLETNSWRTWVPVPSASKGDVSFELGDMNALGAVLRDGDTEEWSWVVDSDNTGAIGSYEIVQQSRGDGQQNSNAVLWGTFPVRAGTVSITPHYKACNAVGDVIYESDDTETQPITVTVTDTARMLDLRFQPGQAEYFADENGFVHVDSLIPYEADGAEHAAIHCGYWLESGPDMDTAEVEITGEDDSMQGVDLRLNPDQPGTYVLCQNAWTFGVGEDNQCMARIRVVVGGEAQAGVTLRAGDTYPVNIALHNDVKTVYFDFHAMGAAIGDTLTWNLQRLSGTSAELLIAGEQGQSSDSLTQTLGVKNSEPRCLLAVNDCASVGETMYRLSLNVQTADGKTFTASSDFAVNVVDDAADPDYLPVITPATTAYTIQTGEILSLDQPTVTLPAGVKDNDLCTYWACDSNLYKKYDVVNGKINVKLCALEPGYYTARFVVTRGLRAAYADYQITVCAAEGELPVESPVMRLRGTDGEAVASLSATLASKPGVWVLLGNVTLTGVSNSPANPITFAVTPAGNNIQVMLRPVTRFNSLVYARSLQYNAPNESFDLTATRDGTEVAGTSFTLSAPTSTIDVTAVTLQNSGADTLLALGHTQLGATVAPNDASDASVTWSVSDNAVATVSNTGLVTARDVTATAQVTVTATSVSNPAVKGTYTLSVVPRIQSITVTAPADHVLEQNTLQLTAATAPADASDAVRWSSSDENVALVDETGLLTAGAVDEPTSVTLTATADDGSADPVTGLPVTGTLTVTVQPVVLTDTLTVSAAANQTTLTAFTTVQLSAASTPDAVTYPGVIWQSENSDVAAVSDTGLVTAGDVTATANVTLTATATDGSGVTGSLTLTVVPRIRRISISGEGGATAVQEGLTLQLTAVTDPADASDAVVWSSANENVATVGESGLITAKRLNADTHVVITATAADLTGVAGAPVVKQTFTLTVKAIVNITSITLTPASVNLLGLATAKLNATVSPAAATYPTVSWTSANPSVLDVDENGLLTAGDVDQVTTVVITATANDENKKTATRSVTVTPRIKSITISGATHDLQQGKTLQLSAATLPAAASKAVTWHSDQPDYVTVDSKGLVAVKAYDVAKRNVTITAVADDGSTDASGNLVVGRWDITVCPLTTGIALSVKDELGADAQTISLDATDHKTLRITPTVTPAEASKNLLWTVKDPTVLSLTANEDGSMTATGLMPGQTTVTVAAGDSSGVTAATQPITVTKAPTAIGDYGAMTLSVGMSAQIDAAAISHTYLDDNAITGYTASYDGQSATSKGVKVSATGLITVEALVSNAVITLTTADRRVFAGITLTIQNRPDSLELKYTPEGSDDVVSFGEIGSTVSLTVIPKAAGVTVPATLTAASANAAIVSVTQTDAGTFSLKANGLGSTTVSLSANGTVLRTITANVNRMLTGVTLTAPETLYAGKSAVISANFSPVDASDKTLEWDWEPKDSDVSSQITLTNGTLSVSPLLGRVLDVEIKASYYTDADKTEAGKKTAVCNIRLVPLVKTVTIAESGEPLTTFENGVNLVDIKDVNAPIQLTATLSPAGVESYAAVQWTSSVPAVATVQDGAVTVYKAGDTVITAAALDGSRSSGTFKLSVCNRITDITVTDTSAYHGELIAGSTQQLKLTAACLPLTATNKTVTWSVSEDTPFVSVSSTGVVTVNKLFSGDNFLTAEVIATARDGSNTQGSFLVTVYPAVANVDIVSVGDENVPGLGGTLTFDLNTADAIQPVVCSVTPNDAAQDLVWKSSNASQVAVVEVDGGVAVQLLKPTASSGVTVTATSAVTGARADRVTIIVTCLPTDVTITGTSGVVAGKRTQFTATVIPLTATNRTVTWSVEAIGEGSNLGATSISTTGLLMVGADANGTLQVKATCNAGTANEVSTTCDVAVTPQANQVTITPDRTDTALELTSATTNTLGLTATVSALKPEDTPAQYVVWKSSAPGVATVTASAEDPLRATVTAVGGGSATITATTADGSNKSATQSVTVTCKPQSVSVNPLTTLMAGKSVSCSATVLPANVQNKKVTWTLCQQNGEALENEPNSVMMDANTGVLRALISSSVTAPETVYVKATCMETDANGLTVESVPVAVTVYQKSASVTISSSNPADANADKHFIDLGDTDTEDTLQLYATVNPAAAMQTVTWSTSNSKIADVDAATGLVTAKGVGLATITATTADGLKLKQAYAVTVGVMVNAITVTAPDTSLISGGKMTLTAACVPVSATNRAVTWVSDDTTVATVSSTTGLVTARTVTASKPVTISAIAKDGSGTIDSVMLWVRPKTQTVQLQDGDGETLTAVTINRNQSETTYALNAVNQPYALAGGEYPGEAVQGATFASSKPTVATVDAEGVVTAVSEGTAVITATATDGSRKTAYVTVTVLCKPETVEISGSEAVAYGKSVRLSALVGPTGVANQAVKWMLDPADAALATISASTGTVTAKTNIGNIGKVIHVTATANTRGANGETVASAVYELPIAARTTGVTTNLGLANAAATVALYEGTKQLSAVCAPAEASQQILWSSNNLKVATVDGQSGLVTFVGAGKAVITAAAMDGTGLKATVTLTITK